MKAMALGNYNVRASCTKGKLAFKFVCFLGGDLVNPLQYSSGFQVMPWNLILMVESKLLWTHVMP